MKPDCSCRNCVAPKRYPGCHDSCDGYRQYRAGLDELKKKRISQRQLDQYIAGRTLDNMLKAVNK